MTEFFSNNFTEDRWRKAALKNAFSLLGKQRFQHSAAFFLLAGSLKDAVEASGKSHGPPNKCFQVTLLLKQRISTNQIKPHVTSNSKLIKQFNMYSVLVMVDLNTGIFCCMF